MNPREAGRGTDDGESVSVSPLTVPALLGGLIIGFLCGYLLGWWGAAVIAVIALGAVSGILVGRNRESLGALVLGGVVGYVMVIALAVFRGVI